MPESLDFTLPFAQRQIDLRLYAEGALYWPDGATLYITDPHFGKADSFRHAGIAIPPAVHDRDLARLSQLLTNSQATKLVILGDFFHTRHSQSESTLTALEQWRSLHPALEITLVQGNHDKHAGTPPASLEIQTVEAPYLSGPFLCHHQPQPTPSDQGYILAGHLHPYIILRDRDGSRLRLASFIFSANQAILPAFGGFTGGSHYPPSPNDRVFAIAYNEIVEIPTSRRRSRVSSG